MKLKGAPVARLSECLSLELRLRLDVPSFHRSKKDVIKTLALNHKRLRGRLKGLSF